METRFSDRSQEDDLVVDRKTAKNRKKYQKPEIVHVEKIEARGCCVCAKMVGDNFCETTAPTTS